MAPAPLPTPRLAEGGGVWACVLDGEVLPDPELVLCSPVLIAAWWDPADFERFRCRFDTPYYTVSRYPDGCPWGGTLQCVLALPDPYTECRRVAERWAAAGTFADCRAAFDPYTGAIFKRTS